MHACVPAYVYYNALAHVCAVQYIVFNTLEQCPHSLLEVSNVATLHIWRFKSICSVYMFSKPPKANFQSLKFD